MGFINEENLIYGLPEFAINFRRSDTGYVTRSTLVTFLPVTTYRPEAMRVTQRADATQTWYEVETWSERREQWIAQKEHVTQASAINDAVDWYPMPHGAPAEPAFYRVCMDAVNEEGASFKAGGALVYAANQLAAETATETAEWPRGLTVTYHVPRFFITAINAKNEPLLAIPERITQDVVNRLSVGMQSGRIEGGSTGESVVSLTQSLDGEKFLRALLSWNTTHPERINCHVAYFDGKASTTAWITNYGHIETAMAGTRERFDALLRIFSTNCPGAAA